MKKWSFGRAAVSALVGGCLCWALTGTLQAQGVEQSASDREAQSLFAAGRAAYEGGRFEAALARFEEAFELSGRPGLLYNIGQCLDRLRRDDEAIAAFEGYIAAEPGSEHRDEVEARLAALRRARAARQVEVEAPRSTAEQGGTASSDGTSVAEGEVAVATADVGPDSDGGEAPGVVGDDAPLHEQWWLWTLVGLGVAAAIAVPIGVAVGTASPAREEPLAGDFGGGVVLALTGRF